MNRKHPDSKTSPCVPSVTKDRHPHITFWNAVTTFHTQLGTVWPQPLVLLCNIASLICHFCLRTPPAQQFCRGSMSPFFPSEHLPRAAQNQSSAVKSLVKQVFKALDPWPSTPCPCNGNQPSTTPTAQIQHPAPLNPNQPSPCLVSPKQEQQEQPGFPRAQPQPKKKWQHLPRSFCPAAPTQQHMRKVLWATELLRCCPNPAYRLPTGHPQYALKNHQAKET